MCVIDWAYGGGWGGGGVANIPEGVNQSTAGFVLLRMPHGHPWTAEKTLLRCVRRKIVLDFAGPLGGVWMQAVLF